MFTLSESEKIIALLIALAGGDPDTSAFERVIAGGYDPAFPVTIQACPRPLGRFEIEGETIICGTVSVPEDHASPDGPRIDIVFTVLKSHSTYPEPDPVVHLHGGPGAGLLGGLKNFAGLFDKWRANRDIVMFDQRAAGLSARSTDCYEAMTANIEDIIKAKSGVTAKSEKDKGTSKIFAACVAELRKLGVGLEHYNTDQNARDVAAIVKTLGYDTFNLYGISYGTKLSLEVMRQAPEGLRAVVLDGVAPPSVHLYDTLAVPQNEATVALVKECAADEACNAAYPHLGEKIEQAYAITAAGKAMLDGTPLPPSVVTILIGKRNGDYRHESYTPYLPAIIYEIASGGDMPTLKMLSEMDLGIPRPGSAEVRAAAKLTDEQERLLEIVLANVGVFKGGTTAMDLAIDEFKGSLRRYRELGPLPSLFDEELSKASGPLFADRNHTLEAVKDYTALQNAEPSKDRLRGFVTKYFEGESQERLLALINAMTETEISTAFEAIRAAVGRVEKDFAGNAHLMIYACQEDRPYNSLVGYRELTKSLDYPQLGPTRYDSPAEGLFEACELFEPKPRPGFHHPVVSDIPTLSLGSTWDTQTAASWALLAVETLPNGQAFIIPEAGHGAIAYQECAIDIGVAFIDNPNRKLDNRCGESVKPKFYIAPWVKE